MQEIYRGGNIWFLIIKQSCHHYQKYISNAL